MLSCHPPLPWTQISFSVREIPREKLGIDIDTKFLPWYRKTLSHKLLNLEPRQDYWSKALAVGDPGWLRKVAPEMRAKRYQIYEIEDSGDRKDKIHF